MSEFKMTIMDSFDSQELGLIVTGEVESSTVRSGDELQVVHNGITICFKVKAVTRPGMELLKYANSESGYIGLVIEDKQRGDLVRGDILRSA